MTDYIDRQAAINAVKDALLAWSSMPQWRDDKITEALVELPSAQPEKMQLSKEDATKDATFDCISRQAAIGGDGDD